jgi:predicted HAD superfamily Cof-like phosphohydrolase
MQTIQSLVKEFHDTFRADTSPTPTLSVSLRDLRLRLIHEEFHELLDASAFYMELTDGESIDAGDSLQRADIKLTHEEGKIQNVIEMADALGDIVYVCYGMAIAMGINLDNVIAEIHRANMSKTDEEGNPVINGGSPGYLEGEAGFDSAQPVGKVVKGANYVAPDISRVLGMCPNVGCPHYGSPHSHGSRMEDAMAAESGQ